MKVKYTGESERVFPTLGIIAQPNDEFDAPADFSSADVVPSKSTPVTPSAPADAAQGA